MENKGGRMSNQNLLSGVKVLDLTRVLAGPYCGMMLADMGADVLKIEEPGKGDDSRRSAPLIRGGESAYFLNLNRNKRGMTLNLKQEEGKEVFRKLTRESDIVLENYRPGVMEKLGLGYEELKKINPAVIYGAISGFGHYGPYSKRAGYDIIGQAMSGLMSTTGWPEGAPTRTGTAIGDVVGGMSCCIGVLAAYVNRLKTGLGEKVDISLVDSMVSSLEIINMIYLCTGRIPSRIGNRYEAIYPYDSFPAADGDVIIACGNDKLYDSLKKLLNLEGMDDERFKDNVSRVKNHEPLREILVKWTKQHSIDEIVDMMLDAGIPSAPINTIDRVVKDPHIAEARQMFVESEHPVAGKVTITGTQLKFSEHEFKVYRPAPLLGEHTEEVLASIGVSGEELAKYREKGVV
jgi:crotonobetainyl-CoA:carnitine CoA-transferase CaiB-like acyl-CoA transferase